MYKGYDPVFSGRDVTMYGCNGYMVFPLFGLFCCRENGEIRQCIQSKTTLIEFGIDEEDDDVTFSYMFVLLKTEKEKKHRKRE